MTVGVVAEEFDRDLRAWQQRCGADRARERLGLFLLALEREQIVSVAYREELITARLSTLDIPEDVRELIHHALLWAWKDEEMHAILIRGALMRLGGHRVRARAFGEQVAGAVGGWTSSVRHHLDWRKAPASNAVAAILSVMGRITGRMSRAVAAQLVRGPFAAFCRFNVDAEETAARCWERISELGLADTGLPESLLAEFRQIKEDEDRHRRVFAAIADVLDDEDRLRDGRSAETLAAEFAAIGPFFLPPSRRPANLQSAVATGGVVHVLEGEGPSDKRAAFLRALAACDLRGLVSAKAEARGVDAGSLRACIKPTFMIGYDRRDPSPITDPELVAELVGALREAGVGDVAIVESPTIYDRFYARRTVPEVARYFGYDRCGARLVDSAADQAHHEYARGMAVDSVCAAWRDAEVRISFAKMRSNPVDMATLTVANLEGLGPRHDEYFFAERYAQRDTAVMAVLAEFPPDLALVDAYDSAPDGLLGMMGSARPHHPCRIYAGHDPVAVDMVALRHVGIAEPNLARMLRAARHWFGDVRAPIRVVGTDEPIAGWRSPIRTGLSSLASLLAYPMYQFASGRGALFVPEMDEQAFPPVGRPTVALRLARGVMHRMFGLRLRR